MPLIRIDRGADRLTWVVMSGDRVATRMTAIVEPTDGGRHSHVTAQVERGDAPDDFVSPAFRSKGITMGQFGMAVEGELNKLVSPVDPTRCREALARMERNGIMAPQDRPANLTQAMGNAAKTIVALNAQEGELRRNGCDTSGTAKFETPVSAMGEAAAARGGGELRARQADGRRQPALGHSEFPGEGRGPAAPAERLGPGLRREAIHGRTPVSLETCSVRKRVSASKSE
jgi:hypothetical protein